tara:strand:- start:268 stop:471 length:204 start_codon:yes stop_codon:yes gene_type:complete
MSNQLSFIFKSIEPESDLEKLEGMVTVDVTSVDPDLQQLEWDIQQAVEIGDNDRLSQLLEMKNQYSS